MKKELKEIRTKLNALEEIAKQTVGSPCLTLAMRCIQRARMWLSATLGELDGNKSPYPPGPSVIGKVDNEGELPAMNSHPAETVERCTEMRALLQEENNELRKVMRSGFTAEEATAGENKTSDFFWSYLGRAEAQLREAKMWYGEAMLEHVSNLGQGLHGAVNPNSDPNYGKPKTENVKMDNGDDLAKAEPAPVTKEDKASENPVKDKKTNKEKSK